MDYQQRNKLHKSFQISDQHESTKYINLFHIHIDTVYSLCVISVPLYGPLVILIVLPSNWLSLLLRHLPSPQHCLKPAPPP